MDDLLLESITGFSYKTEADDRNEDRRIKHLSNINETHEDEDTWFYTSDSAFYILR